MYKYKEIADSMREVGLNDFQCGKHLADLNHVVGLKDGQYEDCGYGISSISVFEYRISIHYYCGNVFREHFLWIGSCLPRQASSKYIKATAQQEEEVLEYLKKMIENRKQAIEKAKSNNFETFKDNCLMYAQEYISSNANDYQVSLRDGESHGRRVTAIVIDAKGYSNPSYAQKGYIILGKDKFNEFYIEPHACGVTYNSDINIDNYKETIINAAKWILN